MPKISIIVCVYNSEKFLKKCIESILNQTFKDFELIIVDDGSTDGSKKICKYYEKIDNRIKFIEKNENTGQSDARNIGLDNSNGNYIGFVDSDDWIERDMYELLYKNAIEFNAEISACRGYIDYLNNSAVFPSPDENYKKIIDINKKYIVSLMKGKYYVYSLCNKLIKKELFNKLRFLQNTVYEDDYIALPLLERSKRIVLDSSVKYHYVQNEHSTMHKKDFNLHDFELIKITFINLRIAQDRYPELVKFLEARIIRFRKIIIDRLLYSNTSVRDKYLTGQIYLLRRNFQKIILNKELKLYIKLAVLLIVINPSVYFFVKKLRKSL